MLAGLAEGIWDGGQQGESPGHEYGFLCLRPVLYVYGGDFLGT